ncbi:glycosyltransferase [bacterium]|nr:glycosyltransferase [bacterium]
MEDGETRILQKDSGAIIEKLTEFKRLYRQKSEMVRRLEIELQNLKEQLARKDEHIRALLGSLSWRITAPLRTVCSFFINAASSERVRKREPEPACQMQQAQHSVVSESSDSKPVNIVPRPDALKILYVLNSFPKLSETFVLNEIVELIKRGHDVRILALHNPNENIVNADIFRYQLIKRARFVHDEPRMPLEEKTIIKAYNDIDIVHSHFAAEGAEAGARVASILKKPFTFTAHAYEIFDIAHVDLKRLKYLVEAASLVITPSEYNKKHLLDIAGSGHRDRIRIVRATIDADKFPPRALPGPDSGKNIITMGRLVKKKGTIYLVKAMRLVVEKYPDARLSIVGDGPEQGLLETCIKKWNLEKNVFLLGAMSNEECNGLLDLSDIAVLPCITSDSGDRDVCPLTLQEAMAKEIPVVSTFAASVPELVEDGVSGLLVPEKDKRALAAALIRLIEDPALRKKLGENGRKRILGEFNITVQADKLICLWQTLNETTRNYEAGI